MKACLWLFCLGCGSQEAPPLIALADGLTATQIASVDVTVISNTSQQGAPLDCATLGDDFVVLRDDVVLHSLSIVAFPDARMSNLAPGNKLIVTADAFSQAGGHGDWVGHACQDNVTIKAGQTTPLTLVLAPIP